MSGNGRAESESAGQRDRAAAKRLEDLETGRLVTRFQAGDREAFADLYRRFFNPVYAYLKIALRDHHEAEDAAQQVFVNALEALPRYEHRGQPFRAWLFRIVRNYALDQLKRAGRLEFQDPSEIDRRREESGEDDGGLGQLDWLTDVDLLVIVEHLPLPQRQVLVMRFMLDLTTADMARALGRNPADIRTLQSRAIQHLRIRLKSIGREPKRAERRAPTERRFRQLPVLRARRYSL